MRRRHLPSTRALMVFDAVARHHSVSKAAEELFLTHSAVSQQMRQLEDLTGVQLVQRGPRGSELTEAGRRFHMQVAADLARLESHMLELMAKRPGGSRLLVGSVPAVAERWLVPRLPQFLERHPGLTIHLSVFPTYLYVEEHAFDVGIQYDDAVWRGAQRQPLMDECCVVVGVPYSRWRTQAERGDFRNLPLLQLKTRLGAWDVWFDQAGIEHRPAVAASGHWFDMFSAIIEAARADLGLALVPRMLCERELADGTLVLVHPHVSRSPIGLSIFFAPQRPDIPMLDEFAAWLLDAAAQTPPGTQAAGCVEPAIAA